MKHGYLYYLDGAGGGTAKNNWSSGVRAGLLEAGYPGAAEMFSWESGKGLIADEETSVVKKRAKAKAMAAELEARVKAYPKAPVDILSFSAGTSVAIFALEAVPPDVQVENVVLMGSAMSNSYDLTEALKRVRGRFYVFTSKRDRMLSFAMAFSGTADRKLVPGAGVTGFVLPKDASAETKKLYAEKVVMIPWTKAMEADGDEGRHFDNIKMPFIRDHVAPLLMSSSPKVKP